jgi:hypothetical protein
VAAFITFDTQEGHERASNLKGKKNWLRKLVDAKYRFQGELMEIKAAHEPTNIIWENRDVSASTRLWRKFGIAILVGIILYGTLNLFFILTR